MLVAMANLLPHLVDRDDHALALVHGLTFVANDTREHAPRFPVGPLDDRRRVPSIGSRSGTAGSSTLAPSDAAERTLETALVDQAGSPMPRR